MINSITLTYPKYYTKTNNLRQNKQMADISFTAQKNKQQASWLTRHILLIQAVAFAYAANIFKHGEFGGFRFINSATGETMTNPALADSLGIFAVALGVAGIIAYILLEKNRNQSK